MFMKNSEIKNFLLGLDDGSPYSQQIGNQYYPGVWRLTTTQRLLVGMKDAALGFNLASSSVRARKELPAEIAWSSVRRAYACLKSEARTRHCDPACHEALFLGELDNIPFQQKLKAYLCSGLSYAEIGAELGLSEEVVILYAHLFFDFPERRDYQPFVQAVLDPQSELGIMPTDFGKLEDPGLLLMNLAYRFGPEVLAKTIGQVHKADVPSPEVTLVNAQSAVLASAELKARLGLLAPDQAEFAMLKALLVEKAKQQPSTKSGDPRMGLEALSMDEGAMLVFKSIVTKAAAERQQLAQAYDSQQAAAKAQLTGSPKASETGQKAS